MPLAIVLLLRAYGRLRGLWRALRGRTDWGVMTRSGFSRGQVQDGG